MIATTSQRPKGAGLEKRLDIPPAQPGSSGKLPPAARPTYQGPTGDDPLDYTVPLVPGMQQRPYSSPGKDSRTYNSRN